MRDFLIDILNTYKLEEDQVFDLYVLDMETTWDWGLFCETANPEIIIDQYFKASQRPNLAGLWICISGDGGWIDHTVIKWEKRRGDEPLDRRPGFSVEPPADYKPGRHEKREDK